MSNDTSEIANKLAKIQNRLRGELLEELQEHKGELSTIFDPYSFSPVVQEIRDKYLKNLQVLQSILQELAQQNQRRQPPVKLISLRAEDSEELVELVNRKLARLRGARVMDVEFLQKKEDDQWVAVVTYVANPFREEQDETAAWM
ncbi:MAG: hypothetical protein ACOCSQ_04395 [Planctomycetota bacterium]